MDFCKIHAFAWTAALALTATAASAESDIPQPLDQPTAVKIAAERSKSVAAGRAGAEAARAMGDAEDRLPDPEVMAEAWQVPIARPYAFGDANMLMFSVRQKIPPPGSRGARTAAYEAEARVSEANGKERTRDVERAAAHAFVDAQAAEARHAAHAAHHGIATKLSKLAETRLASGAGRLADVSEAEVESAKLEADVALEDALVDKAHAKLNGLLRRPVGAPLTTVALGTPETAKADATQTFALAEKNRPELTVTRARVLADEASARAADKEASLPTFTVGALYFAPTSVMPYNGYGLSFGATLPWIWGGARARSRAGTARARATVLEEDDLRTQIRVEVASALADVRAAAIRVAVLRDRAKPAADAALEAVISAYQSNQGDAAAVFRAERNVIEVDLSVIDARAELAHALVDLDWAVGAPVPRTAVGGGK